MMASPEKSIRKPSNSTRFPDNLKAFVVWIMNQVKLVDKPASMMRECLKLGVQIRAAGLRPDGRGLYWEMSGPDLAREIEGPVRQAARFCESQGYSILDIPPWLLEELEQTRHYQRLLDGRLARIEVLLTQLAQGGKTLNLAPLLEFEGNGMGGSSSATARAGSTVQSIESNDEIAGRLGFNAGISL
jgi:hypothetical protein